MKRNLVYLLAAILVSAASCSFTSKFDNPDKDKLLLDLISYVLENGHYNPRTIDDDFSEHVYDDYIEALDPLKRYFLQSDIDEFKKYRSTIDDQIKTSDLTFFNLTYDRLMQRMDEASVMYKDVLEKPFDYSKEENIDVDYDNLPYAKTKEELWERWRKQLKFSTLERYAYGIEGIEKKKEPQKKMTKQGVEDVIEEDPIAPGLENDDDLPDDPIALEKKTREDTQKTIGEYFDFMNDLERKDWFVVYLNSIVEEFDPHTFYFAPDEKERFDVGISGKFEGIGARLQKKNDHIKIVEVISGGPAWRGDKVEVGDEIMKVGQENETPVSIVGMRLEDAVKLIKGPKGTKVILTIKRVDGTIAEVPIVRDIVELEETYAKSSIVKKDNRTFGVINLPKFYIDFDDYNNRNAASDVAKEITELKKAGAEGLVLDLRDNGGGSLKTVVDMAGLFIKDGPIVQVKSTGKRKEVLADTDKNIQWDGPLVILVNELSASASEILAAAMQDYKRAIILGSKQTYGKGTVQNVIDLNQFLRGDNEYGDVGALKVTTQKFYRINGGSTQLEGVKSDVVVPDRYSYRDIGEKDQENPLPWDKIDAVQYNDWAGYIDYDETIEKSKERMAKNSQLTLIDENAKWVKKQQEDKEYPLNIDQYLAETEKDEQVLKEFRKISDYKTNLTYESLPYEVELMAKDSVLRQKRERWHANLSKDVYMEEALNVLEDLKMNNIKNNKVANIKD
ncbi:carboxy terminal-processing peptidase [Galbibacter pacificus]|uniref:Carboxy terminal-processing peptidase n=1 Tax=Galbibacter pacificus TaxID=2996052 RepID=A0ABT6FW46_9FLAO|nr:carboxy terminal-processing peptidase [Galbibacter pacificus]MDG3584072.1 carboxy terminal-processing peptidase [Galbibacter pacificus]MDG3587495.1 carboxy terminal-processing peptidase [Galbibacter pacificus]